MIKEYLAKISKDLNRFNQSLTKTSILIDKPWALVDDNNEVQKLIFKKNHDLILSKNGKAAIGKWEYLPEAKSLFLDRGTDKILCNEIFIDKGVIILKLDGTHNEFFALANENLVPDLDIKGYLDHLLYEHPKPSKKEIKTYELDNGLSIEVHSDTYVEYLGDSNALVTIEDEKVKNGFYKIKNSDVTLIVKNSSISATAFDKKYVIENGITIHILQRNFYSMSLNDYVLVNGQLVEDDCYLIHKNRKIETKNGLIKKILVRTSIFNYPLGDFREIIV